jgi:hypothetical protein
LPYPNDPGAPPRTGVAREEAGRLCEARGERLCTEIEWERACRGGVDDPYSTGAAWDTSCAKDASSCASGFGVRGLGVLREWTASEVPPTSEHKVSAASVRGAGTVVTDAGPPDVEAHRCAHRARANEQRGAQDLGFRCCKGAVGTAAMPPLKTYPPYRDTKMVAADVAKVFGAIPELSRIAHDVRLFDQPDIQNVLARSSAAKGSIAFVTAPVLWSPETGAELLVASGRSKGTSWVVALYPLPNDTYRLASYFFMLNDPVGVVLAYDPWHRQDLYWTSCWGCAGEQGSVRGREDHRVIIVQH